MKRVSVAWFLLLAIGIYQVCHLVGYDLHHNEFSRLPREIWNRMTGKKVVYLVTYPAAPSGNTLISSENSSVDVVDANAWPKLKKRLAEKNIVLRCSRFHRVPLDATAIITHGMPWHLRAKQNVLNFPVERSILSIWEPAVFEPHSHRPEYHERFKTVLTWRDDLVGQGPYRRFHINYPLRPMHPPLPFAQRDLLTMINGYKASSHPDELYSERRRAVEFYEQNHSEDFTFYGIYWEPLGYHNYGGAPASKFNTLLKYRFCICYENSKNAPGYISEKIFDCFVAGCVPIYWGDPNVADRIPSNCFVAREDFADDEELYQFLKGMPEEAYNGYLEHIAAYLESDQAQVFSHETFLDTFASTILELFPGDDRDDG